MNAITFYALTNALLAMAAGYRFKVLVAKAMRCSARDRASDQSLPLLLELAAMLGFFIAAALRLTHYGPWAHPSLTDDFLAQASLLQVCAFVIITLKLAPGSFGERRKRARKPSP